MYIQINVAAPYNLKHGALMQSKDFTKKKNVAPVAPFMCESSIQGKLGLVSSVNICYDVHTYTANAYDNSFHISRERGGLVVNASDSGS